VKGEIRTEFLEVDASQPLSDPALPLDDDLDIVWTEATQPELLSVFGILRLDGLYCLFVEVVFRIPI